MTRQTSRRFMSHVEEVRENRAMIERIGSSADRPAAFFEWTPS